MPYVDFTHPDRVPALEVPLDFRSPEYYLRLDALPESHPYHLADWVLFRSPEWLEGGSAWVAALTIDNHLQMVSRAQGEPLENLRPVVGSDDPGYDEAVAQALVTLGHQPLVAEVRPKQIEERPWKSW